MIPPRSGVGTGRRAVTVLRAVTALLAVTLGAGCVGDREGLGAIDPAFGPAQELDGHERITLASEPDCDALAKWESAGAGGGDPADLHRVHEHLATVEDAVVGVDAATDALVVVLEPGEDLEEHARALAAATERLRLRLLTACVGAEELDRVHEQARRLYEERPPGVALAGGVSPVAGVVEVSVEEGAPDFVSLLEARLGDRVRVEVVPEGSIGLDGG